MDLQEKIVQYLDRELNEGDIKELEELLKNNPEMNKETEVYKQIILSIRKYGEKNLRIELDGYLKESLDQKQVKKARQRRLYVFYGSIAASLVILVLFYTQFNWSTDQRMPMQMQMEEMPIHADSATFEYDSTSINKDSVKISKPELTND